MVEVSPHALWRAIWQYLVKLKILMLFDSEIPLLGIYSKRLSHTYTQKTLMRISTAAVCKIKFYNLKLGRISILI